MKLRLINTVVLIATLFACTSQQEEMSPVSFGKDLDVSWEAVTNFSEEGDGVFEARFLLKNNGETEIKNGDWKLFFTMAARRVMPEKTTGNATFNHRNGDLFYVEPLEGFSIPAGETLEVKYYGHGSVIKVSDAPIGLYVAGGENELDIVAIESYTIMPFERPEQINRSANDIEPIPTASYYFEQNEGTTQLDANELAPFTPIPSSFKYGEEINLEGLKVIEEGGVLANEEAKLIEGLKKLNINTSSGIATALSIAEGIAPEGYKLNITENEITIEGGSPAGVFYGVQSLVAYIANIQNSSMTFRALQVEDDPAFVYRGMHLDVARNFQTKETVLKFIDFMAMYKMNALEIYLSEDEGWRIEIEELPELTEVGSQRGHSADESKFIQPAYGSGPFPGKLYGSGYYTREEYKEILRYATERHVKVIPTINVPGHSRAAIKAMQARYDRLMAEGKEEEALEYHLHDPEDESEYYSAQAFGDNILCVCKPSTVKFFVTVLEDIIEMYKEADAPLDMFHSGGDEVPKGPWEKSPICQEFMQEHPEIENYRNLQAYYFNLIAKEIRDRGLDIGGWEEVAMLFKEDGTWEPNPEFADGTVYPYVWNSLWGAQDLAYKLANGGYPVILSNVTNFYFDLAYNKDPQERGLYWGGFVDTKKAFEFIPYDLFKSMSTDPSGNEFKMEDFEGMVRLDDDKKDNIYGLQGQLWGETINIGEERLEYYYLPKIFGLAERAWQGQADWGYIEDKEEREAALWKSWNEFANRVGQYEFSRMSNLGYNYRVPVPGAKVKDGKLHANIRFPGVEIRYTTDGSEPTQESALYEGPVEAGDGNIRLKGFSKKGKPSRGVSHTPNK